jgi:hypothetical protein
VTEASAAQTELFEASEPLEPLGPLEPEVTATAPDPKFERALNSFYLATTRHIKALNDLQERADRMPLVILRQFNNAIEELDLLKHLLRKAVLQLATHGQLKE